MLGTMASLNSLLAAHSAVLLIDASAADVVVGLMRAESGVIWRRPPGVAGSAIFQGVGDVLIESGIAISEIDAFVFCEGPGSILGIRTAAMALRTWQAAGAAARPVYAYRSLELVAHDLLRAEARPPFAVIADARRNAWHFSGTAGDRDIGPLQRLAETAIANYAGELFMPADFRAWATPPRPVRSISYSPEQRWLHLQGADLLRSTTQPEAFLHEESTYAAWTPQIHRAPGLKTP